DENLNCYNRPISLLPILSKVCERTALNQFLPYLELHDRISVKQSGNRESHSTETTMIHTTDVILNAINKQKVTAVVLLDMSKAFDSLNRGILLDKLQDVGASTYALKWFENYLSNRKQAVRINSHRAVYWGHSYLRYTLTICQLSLKIVSSKCYVDDTKLFMSFHVHDFNNTVISMNQDLLGIHNWCFDNCLLLNP
ncbi:Hypothetical predicted protein, partial [Paramuricea clavata]